MKPLDEYLKHLFVVLIDWNISYTLPICEKFQYQFLLYRNMSMLHQNGNLKLDDAGSTKLGFSPPLKSPSYKL